MDDVSGVRLHFRGDRIGLATGDVPLGLEFRHSPVKHIGVPFAHYNNVIHNKPFRV